MGVMGAKKGCRPAGVLSIHSLGTSKWREKKFPQNGQKQDKSETRADVLKTSKTFKTEKLASFLCKLFWELGIEKGEGGAF